MHPADLSGHVLDALAERSGIDPAVVDDVIWGCVNQVGEQALNVGRNAVLAAGWPETVPATTVDRQCGSSQQAAHFAAAGVISGQYDIAVAGGVESMTRVPMGSATPGGPGSPSARRERPLRQRRGVNQGIGAEMIAKKWGLSRTDVDEFSAQLPREGAAAINGGRFAGQMADRFRDGRRRHRVVDTDQGVRREARLETLAKLKPAFDRRRRHHRRQTPRRSPTAPAHCS